MKCKECGYELSDDVKFCGKCGMPTSSREKIKCRECKREMDSNLEYCPYCGKSNSSRRDNRKGRGRRRDGDDDDDEEGGILGGIGDLVGKLFG